MKTKHGDDAGTRRRAALKWVAKLNDQVLPMPDRHVNETVIRAQGSVPDDHVILRDHNDPNDPVIQRGSVVDLAEGTEFYSALECEVHHSRPNCSAPAKYVATVDDKPGVFVKTAQTGRSIRDFFGLPDSVVLFWDTESPEDRRIMDDDEVDLQKGNVFITRPSSCEIEFVDITINGEVYPVKAGRFSEAEIKAVANPDIPASDELSQFVDGQFKLIEANDVVDVVGGEIFASNAPSGGAS